jgi:phosphoribosylaminoimidazole (AIR) synthetase
METSEVRKRVVHAIAAIKGRGQERRQRSDEAAREYAAFLQNVATPVVQQVASALKAEGYAFTVFTPGDGLRLVYDRGRHDFIDFVLDTSGEQPQVIGRVIQSRGSQRIEEERPVKLGVSPAALTDEDVLDFVIQAMEPWLGR